MTLSPSLQKKKKVKKSTLRNKADMLFSLFIRSKGYCEASLIYPSVKCGGILQCAHITTRGVTALRFDPMNALCLCAGHHRFFTHHPLEWVDFLQDMYEEKHAYVMEHKNDKVKKTEDLYREVIEKYKALNKEIV